MKIAIISAQNQGKTTLINDIIKEWPMYNRSAESYRKVIKEQNLPINKEGTQASQKIILDHLIADTAEIKKTNHIISDRCSLDNLVYSMWKNAQDSSVMPDEFIKECIPRVREDIRAFDVIFFLPITKVAPVPIVPREGRDIDPQYIKEIDNIFKALYQEWRNCKSIYFDNQDTPPIIEIFGSPLERIELLKLYINVDGDPIDTAQSVLSDDNIKNMEMIQGLLRDQMDIKTKEDEELKKNSKIIRNTKPFNN